MKPCSPLAGYYVNADGRVFSTRVGGNGERPTTDGPLKELTPSVKPNGYLYVTLYDQNRGRSFYVHRLVCEAFHGPQPDGMEVLHRNGSKSDNRESNLRWGTRLENMADSIRLNLVCKGPKRSEQVRRAWLTRRARSAAHA